MSPMELQSQMSTKSGGWKPLAVTIGWRDAYPDDAM